MGLVALLAVKQTYVTRLGSSVVFLLARCTIKVRSAYYGRSWDELSMSSVNLVVLK